MGCVGLRTLRCWANTYSGLVDAPFSPAGSSGPMLHAQPPLVGFRLAIQVPARLPLLVQNVLNASNGMRSTLDGGYKCLHQACEMARHPDAQRFECVGKVVSPFLRNAGARAMCGTAHNKRQGVTGVRVG